MIALQTAGGPKPEAHESPDCDGTNKPDPNWLDMAIEQADRDWGDRVYETSSLQSFITNAKMVEGKC
jgi:hypothetical protein